MAELMTTGDLQALSDRLRDAVARLDQSIADTVTTAIEVGDLLDAIRPLVPRGDWMTWLDENSGMARGRALACIRLARYKDHVLGNAETLAEAQGLVVGLPRITSSSMSGRPRYPQWMKDAARELRQTTDMTYQQIGDEFGVGASTVQSWIYPERDNARKAREARDRRKARAALKREEKRAAAKRAGDSLGSAYSHLRLVCEAIDRAILETDDDEIKRYLRWARNHVTEAEANFDLILGLK